MRKVTEIIKKGNYQILRAFLIIVFIISASMASDSGSEQDKVRQKENKKAELLEKLEKGGNVTTEDLKSAFRNEKEEFSPENEEPCLQFYGFLPWIDYDFRFDLPDFPILPDLEEMPSIPDILPFSFDFKFKYSDRQDSIPGITDDWDSDKFRDEFSKAMEDVRKSFEKYRESDWLRIQEEMRKAMEDMRKGMEELREKYRNEKENLPVRKGIPII